ncbi:MAG TPA: signal peptidase II [Candidatus Xenobia bacterium]|nr:signal peptidase II [Candidatus Xenobia bacterium]
MSPQQPDSRGFYLSIAFVTLLLDQLTKWLVTRQLELGEIHRVLPGVFNFTHLQNRGAAFGLFADSDSSTVQALLIAFSVAALILVLFLLWRGVASAWAGWGLGLILGGALGNLIDRLRAGSVVDFLDFHLGRYHWPAFNLADSAVVLGAVALMIEVLRHRKEA